MRRPDRALRVLKLIPAPDAVRDRLAASIREVILLRSLLRVAERKAACPPRRSRKEAAPR